MLTFWEKNKLVSIVPKILETIITFSLLPRVYKGSIFTGAKSSCAFWKELEAEWVCMLREPRLELLPICFSCLVTYVEDFPTLITKMIMTKIIWDFYNRYYISRVFPSTRFALDRNVLKTSNAFASALRYFTMYWKILSCVLDKT